MSTERNSPLARWWDALDTPQRQRILPGLAAYTVVHLMTAAQQQAVQDAYEAAHAMQH